jgi:hypothetical protein
VRWCRKSVSISPLEHKSRKLHRASWLYRLEVLQGALDHGLFEQHDDLYRPHRHFVREPHQVVFPDLNIQFEGVFPSFQRNLWPGSAPVSTTSPALVTCARRVYVPKRRARPPKQDPPSNPSPRLQKAR